MLVCAAPSLSIYALTRYCSPVSKRNEQSPPPDPVSTSISRVSDAIPPKDSSTRIRTFRLLRNLISRDGGKSVTDRTVPTKTGPVFPPSAGHPPPSFAQLQAR